MFDCCTTCSFQLHNLLPIEGLFVDDDLHVQRIFRDETIDGIEFHPQIVRVENAEFLDGLELLDLELS